MRTLPDHLATVAVCAALAIVLACGDEGGGGLGPSASESIQVNVTTTGDQPDSDGYLVTLGDTPGRAADLTDTLMFTDLTPGTYTLRLSGIAPNCVVQGANPRSVQVGGTNVSVTFEVNCGKPGAIRADVATTGSPPDDATFTLVLEGGLSQNIGPNGTALFTSVVAGDYGVRLAGLPARCTINGPQDQRVRVTPGDTSHVAFEVTCAEPGNIQVNVTTVDPPSSADGYTIVLDGSVKRSVGVNDTIRFEQLDPTVHSVELEGVGGTCAVSQGNPQVVTPVSGGTVSLGFNVVCVPGGALEVSVHRSGMTGPPLPPTIVKLDGPDGFTLTGSLGVINHLPPGSYEVGLTGAGVAFRMSCAVRDQNPHTVNIVADSLVRTVFEVFCDFE
jgi:hypothetical protein